MDPLYDNQKRYHQVDVSAVPQGSGNHLRNLYEHDISQRCILYIQDQNHEADSTKRVPAQWLGRFTNITGYFLEVNHSLVLHKVKIPVQPEADQPTGNLQVWPAMMSFAVSLEYGGKQRSHGKTPSETCQTWFLNFPARDTGDSKLGFECPKSIDKVVLVSTESSPFHVQRIREYLAATPSQAEREYVQDLLVNRRLHYAEFKTYPGRLAPSNTFCVPSDDTVLQPAVDWIERLHSDSVKATPIVIGMYFEDSADTHIQGVHIQEVCSRFTKAMRYENEKSDTISRIWTEQGRIKAPEHLPPDVRIPIPLVFPNVSDMILLQTLDLHMHYHLQRQAIKNLKDITFDAYPLLVNDSKSPQYAALVEIFDNVPRHIKLDEGASGVLVWQAPSTIPDWKFVVASNPLVGHVHDLYLVIYPMREKDRDGKYFYSGDLPPTMIDLQKAANTLSADREKTEPCKVKLLLSYSDVREKQHYKALRLINRHSSGDDIPNPNNIALVAERILSGQHLKEVGRKSVYSKGFAASLKADMHKLHNKFAKAIGVDGAKISDEQVKFSIDYPDDSPEDGLLLCNGFAGTRKTSTLGLWLSFMYLDKKAHLNGGDISFGRGLVCSKMHKTANAIAGIIAPIVKEFTGRVVIREYGDEIDLRLLLWMLEGQPKENGGRWSVGMTSSQRIDLRDAIECLEEAISFGKGKRGERTAAFKSTAIWAILQELGMIKEFDSNTKYSRLVLPIKASAEVEDISRKVWKAQVITLAKHLQSELAGGAWSDQAENYALDLIRDIKSTWTKQFAAVLVTTVSKATGTEITRFEPTHMALEQAQFVDLHDITVLLAAFPVITKYFIGDENQILPYVDGSDDNSYAGIRRLSFFTREIERGRYHIELVESGRSGPLTSLLPGKLIYAGELKSPIPDDSDHAKILSFFKNTFGSKASKFPHLFNNTNKGEEKRVGLRKSVLNAGVSTRVVQLVQLLRSTGTIDPSDVAIMAPYAAEERDYIKKFRTAFPNMSRHQTPDIGTVLGMMERENKVCVVSLSRTGGIGFMNTPGFWTVALTRANLSTIVIANDTQLQGAKSPMAFSRQEFAFYDAMVQMFKRVGAYVDWPENLNAK